MKITKRNLRKIIRKEKRNLLERGSMTAQGPEPGVDYIMYPDEYTRAAEQLLTPEEFQSVETRHAILAIDLADELAWRYEDSMEGFGSSDRTYEIQGYLNQLGFKTGFPNGSLEVIREGKMKITKRQLRRIIKEEKAKLVKEQSAQQHLGRREGLDILEELRMMGISDSMIVDYLVGNWMSGADAYQSMLDYKETEI